jgi:hypothetical protein
VLAARVLSGFFFRLALIDKPTPPFEIYLWLLIPILVVWEYHFEPSTCTVPAAWGLT